MEDGSSFQFEDSAADDVLSGMESGDSSSEYECERPKKRKKDGLMTAKSKKLVARKRNSFKMSPIVRIKTMELNPKGINEQSDDPFEALSSISGGGSFSMITDGRKSSTTNRKSSQSYSHSSGYSSLNQSHFKPFDLPSTSKVSEYLK